MRYLWFTYRGKSSDNEIAAVEKIAAQFFFRLHCFNGYFDKTIKFIVCHVIFKFYFIS